MNYNSKENVLITGGSGLLGSTLLIDHSYSPTSKELNLLSYSQLENFIRRNDITKIIHCAATVGGVKANSDRMYDFFNTNMIMNMNVLNACKQYELNNSIMILSTCIMPENAELPYTERSLHEGFPHGTNYGYAYAKRMLHIGAMALKRQYGIDITCLIPCNLYGRNDNYNLESGHVIPSLIHKCYLAKKNNAEFSVWGSGNAEREFLSVYDLARVIEQIHRQRKYFSELIVSPHTTHKIKDIANAIAEIMNFDGKITFDSTKPDGIMRKNTDNALFVENFKNFEFTDIKVGLADTIDYFNRYYPNIRI